MLQLAGAFPAFPFASFEILPYNLTVEILDSLNFEFGFCIGVFRHIFLGPPFCVFGWEALDLSSCRSCTQSAGWPIGSWRMNYIIAHGPYTFTGWHCTSPTGAKTKLTKHMILSPAYHFELLILDISQCFTVHLAPKALFQNFEQHFLEEQAEQRHMMRLDWHMLFLDVLNANYACLRVGVSFESKRKHLVRPKYAMLWKR